MYNEFFSRLQNEGQIRSDIDITQIAILTLAMMDGLQIQWLLDPENIDMTESFAIFSKILISYLQTEPDNG